MPAVSNVAVKFSAMGADKVQKSNESVKKSISSTAKKAKKEEKTISSWMQRHKTAMMGMGAAAAGALYMIAKASPSMSAALDSTRMAFSFLAMQIGEDTAPALEYVEGLAWSIAEAYSELPDPVRKSISTITVALAGLTAALMAAKTAQWAFNAAALANPYVALAVAIIALVALVWKLETAYGETGKRINNYLIPIIFGLVGALYVLETRTGFLSDIYERVRVALMRFYEGASRVFAYIRDVATKVINTFLDLWNKVWNTILDVVSTVILTVYYLLTGQTDKIGELWGNFIGKMRDLWGDLWTRIVGTIKKWGERAKQLIIASVKAYWEYLKYVIDPRNWAEIATTLVEQGRNMVKSIVEGIGNIGARIWDWVRDKMSAFVTKIVEWAEGRMGMSPTLIEIGISIVESIIQGIGNIGAKLWDAVTGGLSDMASKVTDWASSATGWGRDIMDNFSSGINDKVSDVKEAASGAIDSVKDYIGFDIQANDRMAQRWGSDLVAEFSSGMESNIPEIQAGGQTVAQNIEQNVAQPAAAPTASPTGAGGGQNIEVNIESGAIQINGAEGGVDETELARQIAQEFGDRMGAR